MEWDSQIIIIVFLMRICLCRLTLVRLINHFSQMVILRGIECLVNHFDETVLETTHSRNVKFIVIL